MADQIRITDLRPVLLSAVYPPGEELRWIGGTIRGWDAALVEVTLEDGTTGLGEVGAGIMAAAAVPGLVEVYRPYVIGREFAHPLEVGDHLRAYTAFWSRGGIASGTAGAIEIAVLDAVAKRSGVPAYELLGGLAKSRVEAYASGGVGSEFDEVLRWVCDQLEHGFTTVKFRAMQDAETTVALLDHVLPALPEGASFVLDGVQASASRPWTWEEALVVAQRLEQAGARWFEEPCGASDVSGYAALRSRTSVPISGIESTSRVQDFEQLFAADAVGIAQPDATFVGGMAAFRSVADAAARVDVAVVPHVWGSAVTFMANLHATLAHEHVRLFEFCRLPNPLRDELLVEPVDIDAEGFVHAPITIGLGVQLTPELEHRFAYSKESGHVIR
ncbi:mandelate racemase/muconate lactonizing enzyme family protein [Ruania alba]|uniref:D-galactarolactone cycloisomerase n=1 Tax=Ruania alba TaxID=648782 RepID=A0A1H5EYQ6_9MICO|nr:mandelate racemase/muconate lactonizing enzyme family protein [Ruania alba]SED96209.1 D-galactarolactone cycloisomerase [Ruania alba]